MHTPFRIPELNQGESQNDEKECDRLGTGKAKVKVDKRILVDGIDKYRGRAQRTAPRHDVHRGKGAEGVDCSHNYQEEDGWRQNRQGDVPKNVPPVSAVDAAASTALQECPGGRQRTER